MTTSVLVLACAGPRAERLASYVERVGEGWSVRTAEPDVHTAALGAWPGLVLLDLPDDASPALVHSVSHQFEDTPLVVSGPGEDERAVEAALSSGALSYLPHRYTHEQAALVLRLAALGAGHRPNLSRGHAASKQAGENGAPSPAPSTEALHETHLTPKQVEVLSYAAEGLSNKQIAARLDISVGTVKLHMTEIYRRLNVERRAEAVAIAVGIERVRAHQIRRGEDGKDVLGWLLPHVTHRTIRKGEVIFRKGDAGNELYYLQRGRVVLEEIGVEMGEGDMFGEIGLFAPDRARTCTARCATDVDLFCLSSEQAKSIYYLNPRFAVHLITLVARRLLADRDRAG